MENSGKTTVAAAMAGGYLLGRTKKAKLALGLVMLVAGRRLKLAPADLAVAGVRQVADTVDLGALREQVSEQLVGAVKTAASAAVDRQVASMVGSLRGRSDALSGLGDAAAAAAGEHGAKKKAGEEQEEPEAADDGEHGAENKEDEEQEEPGTSDKRPSRPRQRAEKDSRRPASGAEQHRRSGRPSREEPKRAPAKRASAERSSRSGR